MQNWEDVKCCYSPTSDDTQRIPLPRFANEIFEQMNADDRYYDRDEEVLIIPSSLLLDFFQPTFDQVFDMVDNALERCVKPISLIFLVGAFANNVFFVSEFRKRFEKKKVEIVSTSQPGIRILQGAAWLARYPKIVQSRCCRWTYIAKLRDPKEKESGLMCFMDEDGEKESTKRSRIVARAGDIVDNGEKYGMKLLLKGGSKKKHVIDIFVYERPRIRKINLPDCDLLVTLEICPKPQNTYLFFPSHKKKNMEDDKNVVLDLYMVLGTAFLRFDLIDPLSGKRRNHQLKTVYNENFTIKRNRRIRNLGRYDFDLRERTSFLATEYFSIENADERSDLDGFISLKVGDSPEFALFKSLLL